MPTKMPQVREYMTLTPHTIAAETSLQKVQELMRQYRVRHLPVKKGATLVGIISDRSVKSALGSAGENVLTAEDIMIPDPFSVAPQTNLDEVVAAMAEEKYGCALIRDDDGKLVGIFTTVDACRALRQVLETFYPDRN